MCLTHRILLSYLMCAGINYARISLAIRSRPSGIPENGGLAVATLISVGLHDAVHPASVV